MPPMPMFPSASSAWVHVVASGIGANTSWWMAWPPRCSVISTATADTSTPSDVTPRSASAAVNLPGPHPTSTVGPEAALEERLVHGPVRLGRRRHRPASGRWRAATGTRRRWRSSTAGRSRCAGRAHRCPPPGGQARGRGRTHIRCRPSRTRDVRGECHESSAHRRPDCRQRTPRPPSGRTRRPTGGRLVHLRSRPVTADLDRAGGVGDGADAEERTGEQEPSAEVRLLGQPGRPLVGRGPCRMIPGKNSRKRSPLAITGIRR